MKPYAVCLHLELLEMVPSRGEQRRLIMSFIRSLADNPYTPGDFTDKDQGLRQRQIKIVGRYAVTYWVDDPVKTVMVVDVQIADQ
jgi:mRNA-degrading endonuclease RelE of RelBE toxin-antitoxin system